MGLSEPGPPVPSLGEVQTHGNGLLTGLTFKTEANWAVESLELFVIGAVFVEMRLTSGGEGEQRYRLRFYFREEFRRRPQAEFCPAILLIERFAQDELPAVSIVAPDRASTKPCSNSQPRREPQPLRPAYPRTRTMM